MIIQLNQKYFSFRYLPNVQHKAISLFFQAGNVGFRRSTIDQHGLFDHELTHCEDVDMGIRVSQHGELFSNPHAEVAHSSNFSLRKILDQWYNRALYQVKLLSKHSDGGIEFFMNVNNSGDENTEFRCLWAKPSKLMAVVFLTPFLLLHGAALLLSLALLTSTLPGTALFLFSAALLLYLKPDFSARSIPLHRRFVFALLRLTINAILLYVSFVKGIREGMLFLSFSK